MNELTRKQQRIVNLATKGGNDATLMLLEEIDALEANIEQVKELLSAQEAKIDAKMTDFKASMPDLDKVLASVRGTQGERGNDGYTPQREVDYKDGYTPQKDIDYRDGIDGSTPIKGIDYLDGKDGKDGKDGEMPIKGIHFFDGKDGEKGDAGDLKELAPEEIRNHLELLQDEERLSITAINGVPELLDKYITGKIPKTYPQTIGFQRGFVKVYDLSSLLDGVTTTFQLPGFFRVLMVQLSSVPVLRLTTDYTVDSNAMKISFTAEVTPATQLAAGQSCLVLYQEL